MSTFIGYPTGSLLVVIDDPGAAVAALDDLVADGLPPDDVLLLTGLDGASRLDGTGAVHGVPSRLLRLVQFMMMNQLPDFASYEAAGRGPHARARRRALHELLRPTRD